MTSIGTAVRKIRTASGMQLSDLARSAKISTPLLSQIESGSRSPSVETLSKIAAALNLPDEALLTFIMPGRTRISGGASGVAALVRCIEKLERIEIELEKEVHNLKGDDPHGA